MTYLWLFAHKFSRDRFDILFMSEPVVMLSRLDNATSYFDDRIKRRVGVYDTNDVA